MKPTSPRLRRAHGFVLLLLILGLSSLAAAQGFQQIVLTQDAAYAFGVTAADLDNDGDMDAATTNYESGTVVWIETLENGQTLPHSLDIAVGDLRGITSGDFDSDGDNDLAVAAYDENRFIWLENRHVQGSDVFLVDTLRYPSNRPWGVFTADVNQDGAADLVTTEYLGNVVRIFMQTNGSLTEDTAFSVSNPMDAVVTDCDGDADLDIFVGSYDEGLVWIESTPAGWVKNVLNLGGGRYITGIAAADLDGDSDTDIVTCYFVQNSQLTWWEKTPSGYLERTLPGELTFTRDVGIADFDMDGDMDIVASCQYGLLRWWQNTGGSFAIRTAADGSSLYSLTTADFDQDGDSDVLVADGAGNRILYYRNTMGIPAVIQGRVLAAGGAGVDNVFVHLVESGASGYSNEQGWYVIHAADGIYTVATGHACWNDALVGSVEAASGETTAVDISVVRPLVELATSSLNLIVQNGIGYDYPLTVANVGDGVMTVSAAVREEAGGDPWLSVSPDAATIPAGESFDFIVHVATDTTNDQNWDYAGQIDLQTNACPDSDITVTVIAYVLDVPEREPGLPREIALHDIYPNPFNSATEVRFALPVRQRVVIELYDVNGRRVQTLVEGEYPAGEHRTRISGAHLASGVYFVHLQTPDTRLIRKALLLK